MSTIIHTTVQKPRASLAAAAVLHFSLALLALGLAVLGRGGVEAFFSEPALVALAIALFALSSLALFSGGTMSAGNVEDRSNRWVLGALMFIGLVAAYLPAYTDREGILSFEGVSVRWAGVVLFVVGGALRIWPVFVLGRRFSGLVAIQPGHTLVTDGIYGVIRNPSYLGLLINGIGWVLAFRSIVGLALAVFLLPTLVVRIRAEEALLRLHFGDAYDAYYARTSRLIPGIY